MLKLTDYEEQMLDGKEGRLKQVAMEKIVKYAKALGAKELCKVTKATLYCGAHGYLDVLGSDDIDEIFSQMNMCTSEELSLDEIAECCFAQTCVAPMDSDKWEDLGVTERNYQKNEEFLDYYLDAGVEIAGSCVPYLTGWIPLMGEHFVTSESHVVLMCNSIWGACGNSDGIEAGFWSAVCGRTPKWGNHIMENRKGTHLFNLECKSETIVDWDLIGYTVGRKLPFHSVPVLDGEFRKPDIIRLKQCYGSMATTSGAEMCHIVGVTPEARTLDEALGVEEPQEIITITDEDIAQSRAMLCSDKEGKVEFVTLGCPHYTIEEIKEVAEFLEGKTIDSEVKLLVWTTYTIKAMADRSGYTEIIQQAGGDIYTSSCPLVAGKRSHQGVIGIVTDSGKQSHYLKSESSTDVYFGNKFECLKSAVTGKWEV
ncbi:aconitase X [Acetohalobium arabaticum]|uniref:Phosphomevalonate dehydratase large subunit-like domain-containing protein n=1 Tax=Acetohalobium arabaticum (strain ATCC 49924 / DSM 5501 / Z-7288) TaxID=574087 RepID=D9QPM3_ACEAZ|nr:aconitase X catalytic domain-containing protein [Acetohalobium arabaticum]ADL12464.1 protein of unknown function DUF521 [Acetohalobium arabaticum DSM 5501]